ncbi:unnamed protein product, partial [Laminaria digitata]
GPSDLAEHRETLGWEGHSLDALRACFACAVEGGTLQPRPLLGKNASPATDGNHCSTSGNNAAGLLQLGGGGKAADLIQPGGKAAELFRPGEKAAELFRPGGKAKEIQPETKNAAEIVQPRGKKAAEFQPGGKSADEASSAVATDDDE